VLLVAAFLVLAVVGPLMAPESYGHAIPSNAGRAPSLNWKYLLGSDAQGHSVLMYVLDGARTTWGISVAAALLALVVTAGLARLGFHLKAVGNVISATAASAALVPALGIALVLGWVLHPLSAIGMVLLLGLVAVPALWPHIGTSMRVSASTTQAWLAIARVAAIQILGIDLTLDFLGIGMGPRAATWGSALRYFPIYLSAGYWWWLLFPAAAVVGALLGLSLFAVPDSDRRGPRVGPASS
jgi:peptide/nickel transport system permease protein